MQIHDNIKRLRKERHLTLEELAKRINTSKQTIHRYENGEINNIPYDKIQMLAKALNCTEAELMGWEDSKGNETKDIEDMFSEESARLSTKYREMFAKFSNFGEMINDMSSLTPEQIKSLGEMAKALKALNHQDQSD